MRQATTRWSVHLLALCALGPLAGLLMASLRAADGGPHATPLVCTTPLMGVALGSVAFLIAAVIAVIGARMVDARAGLFAAGITLAWASGRSGRIDAIVQTVGSGALVRLAIEGLIFGALAVLLASLVYAIGKPAEQVRTDEKAPFPATLMGALRRSVIAPGVHLALPVAVVTGGAVAWLVAVTPLKGQTIAAAFVGGIVASAAGRVADSRTPAQTIVAAIAILATLGPLSAFVFQRGADPVEAAYAGNLFALSRIGPLDWIAGGLLGVPLGVAWAGSLVDRKSS